MTDICIKTERVFSMTERVFSIFHELNQIPRPSHHEERVADYLCKFAERNHLEYAEPHGYGVRGYGRPAERSH